jgi:hypothetical protein
VFALCVGASAQITEIPAMTVGTAIVEMDALNLGPTNLNALNSSGANLANVTLTANGAPAGFYNTNIPAPPSQVGTPQPWTGRALALNANGVMAIVEPMMPFTAFDLDIDLGSAATEFGFSVGDWLDEMVVEFSFQGQPVGSILTSRFSTMDAKFFTSTYAFDHVSIRASRTAGNWVLTSMHVQTSTPWQSIGQGCSGSNGVLTMQVAQPPRIGLDYQLDVTNLPVAGGFWIMVFGQSITTLPGFGSLPFEMSSIGMPGCSIYCDVYMAILDNHNGDTAQFVLPIPASSLLVGFQFFNQAYAIDPGVNAFGATSSNASLAEVQN